MESVGCMKRVLLIVPPTGLYIREDRCQTPIDKLKTVSARPPIDLMYMAAAMEQRGVDCQIRDYPVLNQHWDDFRKDISSYDPDMVILSVTTPSLPHDMEGCRIAKEIKPTVIMAAKGAHFNKRDEDSLKKYPHLDLCFRGEYEFLPAELMTTDNWDGIQGITYRKNGIIQRNPDRGYIQDLNSIPYPARHLVDNRLYARPDTGESQTNIVTNRGCPFLCIYCLSRQVAGMKLRARSPENILGELKECVEKHGIKNFLFRSDTFTMDKKWTINLCNQIVESGLGIKWTCNSRVDTIDEDRLRAMKKAGCWLISFGVESGSDEMLEKLKKGATTDQARKAIQLCKKVGIRTSIYLLIGAPWETEETYKQTIDFGLELDPDFVEFFYVYPFPGTEYSDEVIKLGLLKEGEQPEEAYDSPAIPSLHLSIEQLTHLRKKAVRKFLLRPSYIFHTLKQVRSPKEVGNYIKYGMEQLVSLAK